ncbi:MAG: outer membrane beta-barrel protein [Chitinophagaceae bacterium]|nr:outer membrane beta-barrel protein [Chitinophagaceae bacterium]
MKKVHLLLMGALLLCFAGKAQTDTTSVPVEESDTIRVGSILIIKNGKENKSENVTETPKKRQNNNPRRRNKVSTNWFVVDLGFANHDDRTNYASAEAQNFVHGQVSGHPAGKTDFNVKPLSFNLNIWLFMQRTSLYKQAVNLKYGLGVELYKYYYKSDIRYIDGPEPYVERLGIDYKRNKFAFDYVTVPLMLNINPTPHRKNGGLNISAGISAGYLYGARNKQKSEASGKEKFKSDFNLERWKFAYVGELGLGPVRLYGSYAITPLHQYGVDQHPYTVGVRFSSW